MKNMKVSMKLVVSFLIVIALAIAVGVAGIIGMSSISSAEDRLYNENVVAMSAAGDIRETFQAERVQLRNICMNAGDNIKIEEYRSSLADLEDDILLSFSKYEMTISDESMETSYYYAKNLYMNEFSRIKEDIISASRLGFEEAYTALFSPDLVETMNAIMASFNETMRYNDHKAKETADNDTVMYTTMLIIEIVILAVAVIVALFFAFYISGLISTPLKALTVFMNKASSTGNITLEPVDLEDFNKFSRNKDEIGQSIGATEAFIGRIGEISELLASIAGGDLTKDVNLLSEQDTMGIALHELYSNLNRMFGEIITSSAQVSTGSTQIADGAQALAQGATEQAASIEQLSSSISEISQKTRENAEKAHKAADLAVSIKGDAEKGNRQMEEMILAVNEISEASGSINKVIKVIDDIAFQTNILALNAAVEAARAGQHGKGFAVVAEEVRSLAAKSAEAAKDTGGLIENSIEKASLGVRIAGETAESLSEIVAGINESNKLVGEIAGSSEEQAVGINQINIGIDQVAQVVQQNSATAEQSAAASEEMSGQSDVLRQLIAQFKIKDAGSGWTALPTPAYERPSRFSAPEQTGYSFADGSEGFGKY